MTTDSERIVEYVPPKSEAIRAFARAVCEALGERTKDKIFNESDVIHGLAELLEIALKTQAKRLNADQLIDTQEK